MNFLHFALMLFLICSGVMILVSLCTAAPDYERIKGIVFSRKQVETGDEKYVDKTSFKQSEDKMLSIILILVVIILWVSFI